MFDSTHTLIKNNIKCMAWAKKLIHAYDFQSQARVDF